MATHHFPHAISPIYRIPGFKCRQWLQSGINHLDGNRIVRTQIMAPARQHRFLDQAYAEWRPICQSSIGIKRILVCFSFFKQKVIPDLLISGNIIHVTARIEINQDIVIATGGEIQCIGCPIHQSDRNAVLYRGFARNPVIESSIIKRSPVSPIAGIRDIAGQGICLIAIPARFRLAIQQHLNP